MTQTSWSINSLLQTAFEQTQKKFTKFFLINLLMIASVIAVVIASLIVGSILVSASIAAKATGAAIFFGIAVGIAGIIALIYLQSLFGLSLVQTMIAEKPLEIFATIKSMKPYVWGYVWLSIIIVIFLSGLTIFNILSLFIVVILWAVWSTFTVFAYLQYHKNGLASLWISQQKIHGKFWSVLWRVLLVNLIFLGITLALSLLRNLFVQELSLQGVLLLIVNIIFNIITILVGIFQSAFVIVYTYTMYQQLPEVAKPKTPKVWIGLSIAGWILMVAGIAAALTFAWSPLSNSYRNLHPFQTSITPTPTQSGPTPTATKMKISLTPTTSPKPRKVY